MITVEYLQEQIKQLEENQAKLVADANATRGAIEMCRHLIGMMEKKDQADALNLKDLEKQMGVKMDDPEPL
jgi:hypothetical protein